MEGIDYLEDALKAMNTGAANLNSKTLAQINAMNIELKNADGSLAGKYKLSEFLENVIYSYLSTTKASSLASVLGDAIKDFNVRQIRNETELNTPNITTQRRIEFCAFDASATHQGLLSSMCSGLVINCTLYSIDGITPYTTDCLQVVFVAHPSLKIRVRKRTKNEWSDFTDI